MGLFDTLWVSCPSCGKNNELQSKGGRCLLRDFSLDDVTEDVLDDVDNPFYCEGCSEQFEIVQITRPSYILRKVS